MNETLRCILKKAPVSRFGDGEFAAIQGRIRHKFQTVEDEALAARLKEVLHSTEDGFLVAIADNYGSLDQYTEQAKREIPLLYDSAGSQRTFKAARTGSALL